MNNIKFSLIAASSGCTGERGKYSGDKEGGGIFQLKYPSWGNCLGGYGRFGEGKRKSHQN